VLLEFLLVLAVVLAKFDANKMMVNFVEYLTGSYPYIPKEQRKGQMIVTKSMQ